ncbi:MAG: nucleotidyltransferase family protein [Burkholderiales bacterium]|nr:nucleotidyltransferase family protein [Burkholderiales bacterium]
MWTGILLAAGRGSRFDPAGTRNKLLQTLDDNRSLAECSAAALLSQITDVLVVVRPDSDVLANRLAQPGCQTTICVTADQGMSASLKHALQLRSASRGWIIALADMPFVQTATIRALLSAMQNGADIAVPVYQGRRGNPVGFSQKYLPQLLTLHGDQGARRLLQQFAVHEVLVDDAGIHRDIDFPADLAASQG